MIAGLAWLSCVAACAAVLTRVLPSSGAARGAVALALAAGLGTGLASFALFAAALTFDSLDGAAWAADLAIATAFSAAAAVAWRRLPPRPVRSPPHAAPGWLAGAAAVSAAAAAWQMFALASVSPHGSWDAWAIWNVAARFLVRAHADWTLLFERAGGGDYPLLLPLTTARAWVALGSEAERVPALIGIAYAAATAGLLVGVVALLRGWTAACVAGAVLAGTRPFVVQTIWQGADVPLGFYFLATLGLLALAELSHEDRRGLQAAAGVAAGCAAWTKNEGMLFLLVVVAVSLAFSLGRDDGEERQRNARARSVAMRNVALVLGALVPLAAVLTTRTALAPPSYLFEDRELAEVISKLIDPERHALVLRAFAASVLSLGRGWLGLLVVYAAVCGFENARRGDRSAAMTGATLALMGGGYFVTYLISPLELDWHLETSCQRLWVQLWPGLLLVTMLALRPFPHAAR